MATFTYIPSYSSSLDVTPRIIEAKFGDGYEQAMFEGLDHTLNKYALVFNNVSIADAATIVGFFTTNSTATTPFDWTDPDGAAGKYKCKTWKKQFSGTGSRDVSCTFEEVPFA